MHYTLLGDFDSARLTDTLGGARNENNLTVKRHFVLVSQS